MSIAKIIELEKKYNNPISTLSLLIMKQQMNIYEKQVLSGQLPQELMDFYQ